MEYLIIWSLVITALTWNTAKYNGRDQWFAVLMGLLFGIFAFITYLIIGKSDELKYQERLAMERRLKKELAKE